MKSIYLFILLFVLPTGVQAQDSISTPTHKKESNKLVLINIAAGANFDLAHRPQGNLITALTDRQAVLPAIDLRMLHFVSRRWGWYLNLRIKTAYKQTIKYSEELSLPYQADYYVYHTNEVDSFSRPTVTFDIGASYRIDFKRWSIYPRIGIGVNTYNFQTINFRVKKKGSNELRYIQMGDPWSGTSIENVAVLAMGINANYKVSKNCYLFADITYLQPLQKVQYEYTETNPYSLQSTVRRTYRSRTIGRELNISAGIGFPIHPKVRKKSKTPTGTAKELMEYKRKRFGLFPQQKD